MKIILRQTLKFINIILIIFVVSVVIGNVIVPAFHRDPDEDYVQALVSRVEEEGAGGGERILCIDDNEEALLWRLRMIGSARSSLVLASFDFRADNSGTDIIAALYEAAERGVQVRILVDGLYQAIFSDPENAFGTLCSHENVEIRIYNPVKLKNIYELNYRMHDKYLIVDGQMYLLGGRNTNDIFLGDYTDGINVDRDILVYSPETGKRKSLKELQAYFQQIWGEPCVQKIAENKKKDTADSRQMLREHYQDLKERYPDIEQFTDWEKETFAVDGITLLTNGTEAENKSPGLLDTVGELAAGGKDVVIQTPYIICDSYMYDTLERIADNADLKIILNAVERGSNPWGCTDYLNNREKVLNTGCAVYEVMNDHAVHTKTVLIDDCISIVGSYNLDIRSTYLDTELMLVIDSEKLNAHIREMASGYMEKSICALPDGRLQEGKAYEAQDMGVGKKLFYFIIRIIIVPFRHLL